MRQKLNISGYEIDTNGVVFGKKGNPLKTSITKGGYECVSLTDATGHRRSYLVHRLVMLTFNPIKDVDLDVNHINGDKLCNELHNLEWSTRSENIRHAIETGLQRANGNRYGTNLKIITLSDINLMKDLRAKGFTQKEIARTINTSIRTVRRYLNNNHNRKCIAMN